MTHGRISFISGETYVILQEWQAHGSTEWHEPTQGMHQELEWKRDHPLCFHSDHYYWYDVGILVGAVRNIASSVFHKCSAPSCSSISSVFCSVSPLSNESRGFMIVCAHIFQACISSSTGDADVIVNQHQLTTQEEPNKGRYLHMSSSPNQSLFLCFC